MDTPPQSKLENPDESSAGSKEHVCIPTNPLPLSSAKGLLPIGISSPNHLDESIASNQEPAEPEAVCLPETPQPIQKSETPAEPEVAIGDAPLAIPPIISPQLPPLIEAPQLIPGEDEVWGPEPTSFWKQLVEECEQQRATDAVQPAILNDLAKKIATTPPSRSRWEERLPPPSPNSDVWIIGDLHGDLLSFKALTEFAKRKSHAEGRDANFCFLGDFFDDGPFGCAVLFEVMMLATSSSPALMVVGNHDLALDWNSEDARFTADVTPHDFADELNNLDPENPWRNFAIAAIGWLKVAPRALVLDDGTLVAHGGCVHSDRLDLLDSKQCNHPEILEDLVWLRAHDNAKRKIPNRTSRGCQFGVEDLTDFLSRISQVTGQTISRVIRGHDHVTERWAAPKKYAGRLLTLNAMSWRQRDPFGPFVRQPVIARYRANISPELYQVQIPEEHILRLYGAPPGESCATSAE